MFAALVGRGGGRGIGVGREVRVGGGVVAVVVIVRAGPGGVGEPLVTLARLGDVADGGVDAVGAFELVELVEGEFAAVIAVAPFAVLLADEVVGRGEAGAPGVGQVAPPDGFGLVGGADVSGQVAGWQVRAKLRKLRFSRGRGSGCEREEASGLGTGPLLGGPARAGGGIEVGHVDVAGERGAAGDPAIGAGKRGQGREIGDVMRCAGLHEAGGEEQPGARGRCALVDQVEKGVELTRDRTRGGAVRAAAGGIGEAVEPVEHVGGEAIVVAEAGDDRAVGAGDHLLLPLERAGEERVGERFAREQPRAVPGEREGGPVGAAAKGVGRAGGHPGAAAGLINGVAAGDGFDKGALTLGRPAVVAAGTRPGPASGTGGASGAARSPSGGRAGVGGASGVIGGTARPSGTAPPSRARRRCVRGRAVWW